ncbi:hypothetical protein [Flavivirga jejuensis]|uniref:Lipoprotein n=1 Tax=Flavivirga jejuensis TaxID=870487 RepID=A0ABT8WQK1_9FLAO|nr:hypothetical protein [Flavivirga jejuensis]MDO5975453.1 hypothetical protein [Flavivirga jejuensis]
MKKLMLSALLIGALGFTSCGSDDDGDSAKSCETLAQELTDTLSDYVTDQSVENCNAYKAALQALVDNGTCLEEGEEATTQALIDGLDCAAL